MGTRTCLDCPHVSSAGRSRHHWSSWASQDLVTKFKELEISTGPSTGAVTCRYNLKTLKINRRQTDTYSDQQTVTTQQGARLTHWRTKRPAEWRDDKITISCSLFLQTLPGGDWSSTHRPSSGRQEDKHTSKVLVERRTPPHKFSAPTKKKISFFFFHILSLPSTNHFSFFVCICRGQGQLEFQPFSLIACFLLPACSATQWGLGRA